MRRVNRRTEWQTRYHCPHISRSRHAARCTPACRHPETILATPTRHGGKGAAEKFFLEGMTEAMHRLSDVGLWVYQGAGRTVRIAWTWSEPQRGHVTVTGQRCLDRYVMHAASVGKWL